MPSRRPVLAASLALVAVACSPQPSTTVVPGTAADVASIELAAPDAGFEVGVRAQARAIPRNQRGDIVGGVTADLSVVRGGRLDDGGVLPFGPGELSLRATVGAVDTTQAFSVRAPSQPFGRAVVLGTFANEGALAVQVDGAGNVYLAGGTNGALAPEPVEGGSDAYVARVLPNGVLAWVHGLPTSLRDGATSLALHPEGGVVVTTGSSGGSVTTGEVARFDADGQLRWHRAYGWATPMSALVTADGRVFVAGYFHRYGLGQDDPVFGSPLGAVVLASADGVVWEVGADGAPVRGVRFASPEAAPRNATHAFFTYVERLALLPGTRSLVMVGNQQNDATGGATAFVRRVSLDTLELEWVRYFGKDALTPGLPPADPQTQRVAQASVAYDVCVDVNGVLRVAWGMDVFDTALASYEAQVSAVDAAGNEVRRTQLPRIGGADFQLANAIACAPTTADVAVLVAKTSDVNLSTHPSALARLDAQGTVTQTFEPPVLPPVGLSLGTLSLMGLTWAPSGVYFSGDLAGTYAGQAWTPGTIGAGASSFDAIVGRLEPALE